jgi:hypothetical protein
VIRLAKPARGRLAPGRRARAALLVVPTALSLACSPPPPPPVVPTPPPDPAFEANATATAAAQVAAAQATATAVAAPDDWRPVASWAGAGATLRDTEPFDVTADTWRVRWEAQGRPRDSLLQVVVYGPDDRLLGIAVNQANLPYLAGTWATRGGGRYSLQISAGNLTWVVTVEERAE